MSLMTVPLSSSKTVLFVMKTPYDVLIQAFITVAKMYFCSQFLLLLLAFLLCNVTFYHPQLSS
jgi:hypothetical protein